MGRSKLEADLAQHLYFASHNENAPWPYPEPIREWHPYWCCEHLKRMHDNPKHVPWPSCVGCENEDSPIARHDYRHDRDWRVDFAWPSLKVAAECEGITFTKTGVGRHQTVGGFRGDLEKYAQLELDGWRVIRVGRAQINGGVALTLIEQALKERS